MAVIFAAIGGGAVIAAIAASDDYGDHSDYSAYSNQAEQERKRKLEKRHQPNALRQTTQGSGCHGGFGSRNVHGCPVESGGGEKMPQQEERGFRRKNHHGDRPAFGADRRDTGGVMPYDVRCNQPFCRHDGQHGGEI